MAAYRESFRDELAPGRVDELRWEAPGNFAPGKESLATQAAALGRRAVTQACGAEIQQSVPYITEKRGLSPPPRFPPEVQYKTPFGVSNYS